jgi:hypothetical protein
MSTQPQNPDDATLDGDELLDTGQEEVFSKTEVESGRTEHKSEAGSRPEPPPVGYDHSPAQVARDEAQTLRQAPDNAGPGEASGG